MVTNLIITVHLHIVNLELLVIWGTEGRHAFMRWLDHWYRVNLIMTLLSFLLPGFFLMVTVKFLGVCYQSWWLDLNVPRVLTHSIFLTIALEVSCNALNALLKATEQTLARVWPIHVILVVIRTLHFLALIELGYHATLSFHVCDLGQFRVLILIDFCGNFDWYGIIELVYVIILSQWREFGINRVVRVWVSIVIPDPEVSTRIATKVDVGSLRLFLVRILIYVLVWSYHWQLALNLLDKVISIRQRW